MLYTINYHIDMTMRAEDRRKAVANAIRKCLSSGNEVRFSKDYSMWSKSNRHILVLCAYGYRPIELNIDNMTFEDVVDEIVEAFNF